MHGEWVYIPTLDRVGYLKIVVPVWMSRGFNVAIVCEHYEKHDIIGAMYDTIASNVFPNRRIEIVALDKDNGGAGYARQACLRHAGAHGLEAVILADDDIYPAPKPNRGKYFDKGIDPGGRMRELIRVALGVDIHGHEVQTPTLSCAASFSYQDLATNGKVSDPNCDDLLNLHNGNCFAVNVRIALALGGFDEQLGMWEDAEFMRNGIANGYPWYLHPGVHYSRLNNSGAAGGVSKFLERNKFSSRDEAEQYYRQITHNRWPKYVSPPDKRPRMRWQQMYEDYDVPYTKPNK